MSLRYGIVAGIDIHDSRVHNCPPRWNGAPNQGLPVGFHELLEDSHKLLAYLTAITIVIYIAGAASTPLHQAK